MKIGTIAKLVGAAVGAGAGIYGLRKLGQDTYGSEIKGSLDNCIGYLSEGIASAVFAKENDLDVLVKEDLFSYKENHKEVENELARLKSLPYASEHRLAFRVADNLLERHFKVVSELVIAWNEFHAPGKK